MLKRFATLILILAALAGCTEKAPPVTIHEPDQTPTAQEPQPVDPEKTQTQVTAELQSQVDASQDPLIDVLMPLARSVFNNTKVHAAASRVDEAIQLDLMNLNGLMLSLPVENRQRKEYKDIIQLYIATLNLECGQIKANCIGLKYLRTAGNSYGVIKIAASMHPDKAARLVLFAVDLKNRLPDLELLEMVLTKVPPSLLGLDLQMQQYVRNFLDTSIAIAERSIQDPAESRRFLTAIKAWNLIMGLEWKISSGSKEALWLMIGRARMLYDGNGQLTVGLRNLLAYVNSRPDSLYMQQIALQRAKLFYPEAIGGGYITKFDELFYLVDAVYRGEMIPRSAAEVFIASGRNAKDLSAMVEQYSRMRFAFALRDSSLKAKEIFTAAIPSEQLLWHSLQQAPMIKRIWGSIEGSLEVLKVFSAMAIKAKDGGVEEELRLRKVLNSFGESVNMVAVYPHTLLLFYYMSQKNFKISLRYAGEITTSDLTMLLYYGTWEPLLPYTDSNAKFNNFEIMHAFDMAIRTNLFPLVGLAVDDYMSDTLRRLDQIPISFIEKNFDLIKQRYQEARPIANFRNVCEELRTGVPVNRVLDIAELKASAYYGDMIQPAFTGVTSKGGTYKGTPGSLYEGEMGLFYPDGEFNESLERMRLDLRQYLVTAEAMLTSYSSYLKRYERKNDAQIAALTVKTRAEVERIKTLRQRILNEARNWTKTYGECYAKIALNDWKVENKILRAEEAYLRQVHRDIKKLRSGTLSSVEKNELLDSYKLKGMPDNFSGQDAISADGYRVSQVNLFVRIARYMKSGIRTETQNIAAIAPHIDVNLGAKMNLDTPLVRDGLVMPIQFTESEDTFVADALKTYFAKKDFFITWAYLTGLRVLSWDGYVKSLVEIYRIEREPGVIGKTVTVEQIMQAHETYMKLVEMDEDDRWMISTLKMQNRFDLNTLQNKLLIFLVDAEQGRYALQSYMGLYDMPHNMMLRERIGWDYDFWANDVILDNLPFMYRPRRFGYQEYAQNYYKVRSNWVRGKPLVPLNKDLDALLDMRVKEFVQSETGAIKEFIRDSAAYTQSVNSRPLNQRPAVDIALDIRLHDPLITDAIPHSWKANDVNFNRNTQNCFVEASCADFR